MSTRISCTSASAVKLHAFTLFLIATLLSCLSAAPSATAAPGDKKWETDYLSSNVDSSPTIGSDGTIYVGVVDLASTLYAVNPSDGTKKWQAGINSNIFATPAVGSDGTIYVGASDKKLHAVNPSDGSIQWDTGTMMSGYLSPSPAIGGDGTIYVGSYDHSLYAVNPSDGSKKWSFETGNSIESSPAVGEDGTIYVGSNDGKLYALNPADGSKKWDTDGITNTGAGGQVRSSPAIGEDGTIYAGVRGNLDTSDENKLYAVNPDGSLKWVTDATDINGQVLSSPVIGSDGSIYIGANDKKLHAFNPTDGSQKWSADLAYIYVESTPAIGKDGTIYVGTYQGTAGRLYAINPSDGSIKWESSTIGRIKSSPAIGDDGTVYIGSGDNKLYAFEGGSGGLADTPWPKFRKNAGCTGSNEPLSTDGTSTVSAVPANGATDAARDTTVVLTFTQAMKTSTVDLSISPLQAADYTTSWSSGNKTLTVTFKQKLAASTKYTLEIPATAETTGGTALGTKFTSSFTTKAATDEEKAAQIGGAPTRPEVEAMLSRGGVSTSTVNTLAAEDILLIPDTIAQTGTKGAATGSDADKNAACGDAESFCAIVAEANMAAGFNPANTVASVKGLQANATSSTSASPKIVTLYVSGYLASGAEFFPRCFKANEATASTHEFTYVDELTSAKIKEAADGDDKAGFALVNPATGAVVQPADTLPPLSGGYTLMLFIRDNSRCDTNSAWGTVEDPSYLTSGSSSTGTGSSSGCMLNPTAGFGLEWLMVLLMPLIGAVRMRLRNRL